MIRGKRKLGWGVTSFALCVGAISVLIFGYASQAGAEEKNTCVVCHSDPNFATFNKKIRIYFLKWENSNHAEAGVTCNACHAGDPVAATQEKSHVGMKSPIRFTEIPGICGNCHGEIYESFTKSFHYKYLEKPDALNMHGANCVTCHSSGSPDAGMGANPGKVEKACELCHNAKTRNFPEIPQQAMVVLMKFNAVQQQFNRLLMRTGVMPSRAFIKESQGKVAELAGAWHSFDLKLAGEKTDEVLALLKEERKKLRKIQTKRIYEKGNMAPLYGN